MLLSVHELALHSVVLKKDYAEAELNLEHPDVESVGPLHVNGEARLVGTDIAIRLHVEGQVHPRCARCLEPVTTSINRDWQLVYHPVSELAAEDEVEIRTAETEVGFFRGEGVELDDVVREQVLLSLPMRTICREECRGICPTCGANLNAGPCGCVRSAVDERWRGLAALSKRKERPGEP